MAGLIINGGIPSTSIVTQTSKGTPIKNEQHYVISNFDINLHEAFEKQFESKFQGDPATIYNCHGLTLASRRTGIFDNTEIIGILEEEYREIKRRQDALVGDIVTYYDNEGDITHSGLIIEVNKEQLLLSPLIRVLSKTRAYKEIIHLIDKVPTGYGSEKRIFRINHAKPTII